MSRQAKIIIFSVILIFSIYQRQNNDGEFPNKTEIIESNKVEIPGYENNKPKNSTEFVNTNDKVLFIAKPNKNILGINERLQIDFEINRDGDNFQPPNFKGFNVIGGPKLSIQHSYSGGKRLDLKSYTYFLIPKSKGNFTINQAIIEINGKTYKTAPLKIIVSESQAKNKNVFNNTLPPFPPFVEPTPRNGYSPYDKYFSKGIYNNSSGNSFKIENSNETDAVVLLVNAYSGKKIRNEFVRKGTTFEMSGVPNGTYYLEWFSGTDWWGGLKVGTNFKGGFQTKASFTKTKDASDWMKVEGYQIWTVTLYSVAGGDVESEKINAEDFFN